MLAKILAGVVAAVAVTGVGIYYAGYDNSRASCPGHNRAAESSLPVSEGTGCCAVMCPAEAASTEPASCCAANKANTDSLAACVGGMALTSAKPASTTKAAIHCCED